MSQYVQRSEIPKPLEYCQLRVLCDLSPRSEEGAGIGLPQSLFCTTIRLGEQLIAMGRVIGDGGCNFEIVDVAVHPEHQRRGLGTQVMDAIMEYLEREAPPDAYICLLADRPAQRLYPRYGFQATAPHTIGMAMIAKPTCS